MVLLLVVALEELPGQLPSSHLEIGILDLLELLLRYFLLEQHHTA
jgi:hypothetical protein